MQWEYSANEKCPICGKQLNYSFTKTQRLTAQKLDKVYFRFNCPSDGYFQKAGVELKGRIVIRRVR